MSTRGRMPIREFSMLTGISKDSLRFYDKIGLLSPEVRGENGYRYYAERQVELGFLIGDLRAMGVGLEEIKQYAAQRSPAGMLTFFHQQEVRIEAEIARLRSIQDLMHLRMDMARRALEHPEDTVQLEERVREPIFLCPPPGPGDGDLDLINQSYAYGLAQGINLGAPMGGVVPGERIGRGDGTPARYYFKTHKNHNGWKEGGTYAVAYCRLIDQPGNVFYGPLLEFLQKKGLEMAGDAYHEFLLDECAVRTWEEYRVRIEVRVEEAK